MTEPFDRDAELAYQDDPFDDGGWWVAAVVVGVSFVAGWLLGRHR